MDLAGALEAVEAGALPAVEAGLGAIGIYASKSGSSWRQKVCKCNKDAVMKRGVVER